MTADDLLAKFCDYQDQHLRPASVYDVLGSQAPCGPELHRCLDLGWLTKAAGLDPYGGDRYLPTAAGRRHLGRPVPEPARMAARRR